MQAPVPQDESVCDGPVRPDRVARRSLLHRKVEALHEELQNRSPEMFERLCTRRSTFKRLPTQAE